MSKDPLAYLKHISDECSFIISVVGNIIDKDDFLQDETVKRALVRNRNCDFSIRFLVINSHWGSLRMDLKMQAFA